MAERDAFTHLIWDNEENLDNLIIEIGTIIMATNYLNNTRYPENITGMGNDINCITIIYNQINGNPFQSSTRLRISSPGI